jgi:hypothetical protein
MRYCTDCRFRWSSIRAGLERCDHPDGRWPTGYRMSLENARHIGPCGYSGKLWEAKPPSPPKASLLQRLRAAFMTTGAP